LVSLIISPSVISAEAYFKTDSEATTKAKTLGYEKVKRCLK
jgi:hypothetical protein